MQNIHPAAAQGFQTASDAYERGRPAYPQEAIDRLTTELSIGPHKTVLDVGAGTGKLTQLLVPKAAELIAVEPVEGMRRKFSALHPQLRILAGSAESIPLSSQSVDAVIAAQAFHWFNGPAALAEIYRVLKPGGKIGLIWNAREDSVDWVARLIELVDPHEMGAPRYKSGEWKIAFEQTELFTPLQSDQFSYVQSGPPEMIVDRIASISFIAALPDPERDRVLDEVRRLLATHPMTAGKTVIELPYRTDVYWCASRKCDH